MNRKETEFYISENYGAEPDFPWVRYPDYMVFRHSGSRKWFAVIMKIPKEKLETAADGMLDILNVKCEPFIIGSLRKEQGIFPAYHMSKDNWVSVALDGSVDAETIKMLIAMSFEMTTDKIRKSKPKV
ncbi:MAG: MmcQ/YjbR family DNA-binding protein [Bacillota bacterium]